MIAAPAVAGQKLYVLNEGDSTVTVIDSWTGAVLGDFRTKSNVRDLDAAHLSEFVVIAGNNDIGWLHSVNNYQQIDLQFGPGTSGNKSTAIGLSPDDQYVYLAQTDPDAVYRVDLQRGAIQDCLERGPNDDHDCYIPSGAVLNLDPKVTEPLHMAVCDDGAVYLVGASGQVARHEQGSRYFELLAIPQPVPDDPRGIACTADSGVFIMSGDRVLTELSSGARPAVTHYTGLPVADPGRIDVDPRRFGRSFQVLLSDRDSGEIVRWQDAMVIERIKLWPDSSGNRRLPWAVTANASGWLGTANQGSDGGMILYQPWGQLPRGTGRQPIDVDFGPVLGAAVEADPYSLEFVYGVSGSSSSAQVMKLRSSGTSQLTISRLEINGSSGFTIKRENCIGQTLAPGQTCDVTIGFAASTSGAPAYANFNADLQVTHNGSPTYINDFPLKAIHIKQYLAELEKSGLSAQ
jgi:hypothetical protein